jgi:hypothetical protein
MWFRSGFDTLFARSSRTPARQSRHASKVRLRPRVEILEDRTVLSTYTVNSLTDTGAGSALAGDLRYCITGATSGNDTITFGVTGTILLESALPALNASVAIQGPGAGLVEVERDPASPNSFGIFAVGSAATVQISGLTIAGGTQGAIANAGTLTVSDSSFYANSNGNAGGGALFNTRTLTISYSTLAGNTDYAGGGGAIYNMGALTLNNSTLSGNETIGVFASDGQGGAICMGGGTLSINSSTVAGNYVAGGNGTSGTTYSTGTPAGNGLGGGLYVGGGTVTIDHSTLAGNQAVGGSAFYPGSGYGGGITNFAGASALQMHDTILADDTADAYPDLDGGVTSLGHNLIGNTTGGSGFATSDLLNVDPRLGPLQNNGGPTQTMALSSGSPAINAGDPSGAPAYDQRGPGFPRTFAGTIDIGAFEVQTLLVVSGFPTTATAGVAGSFTLTAVNHDGSTDTGYTGTVHFTSSDGQAGLPADYTFTVADGGVQSFSATLKTAGIQSLTATDTTTAVITGSETGITVKAAAASTMSVAGFPSPITAGYAGSFTVTLEDSYGNIASGYAGTVHFTSSDGKATLPGNYTFTAGDAGVHNFSAALKTAGTQSITAADTVTPGLTGTDGGIFVNPAAASQFIISAPSKVSAGAAFGLTLTVEDAYGNVVTGYTGTVHFGSADKGAKLPSSYTFTASDKGVHTFTGLVLHKKGNQKITITDTHNPSLTGSVSVDVL